MLAALLAFSIVLDSSGAFRVPGWDGDVRSPEKLAELFVVQVDLSEGNDIPPLVGSYSVQDGELVFRPRYPLQPGLAYRATLRLPDHAPLIQHFLFPELNRQERSRVEQVFPSSAEVPENLLKFYIHFSSPMRRGEAYRRLHLLDERGNAVPSAFLELDQELWDAASRRFTLYFDPGRIKSGVLPHEQEGLPIREGRRYTLLIDADWLDAAGQPLEGEYRKGFTVGPAVHSPIDPKQWKMTPPHSGTNESLTVEFIRPLDHSLLEHEIEVFDPSGTKVEGVVEIDRGEMRWRLYPIQEWIRGDYKLRVGNLLADLAGNMVEHPFEVDRFDELKRRPEDARPGKKPDAHLLPFVVK
jgi:hypothetical protein